MAAAQSQLVITARRQAQQNLALLWPHDAVEDVRGSLDRSSSAQGDCAAQDDGITQADLEQLLDAFPDQPLDFYGAIRCGPRSPGFRQRKTLRPLDTNHT